MNMKLTFGENLGFAIPITYVKDFLRNREAFSFDKENPNTGYRYLDPPRRLKPGRHRSKTTSPKPGSFPTNRRVTLNLSRPLIDWPPSTLGRVPRRCRLFWLAGRPSSALLDRDGNLPARWTGRDKG